MIVRTFREAGIMAFREFLAAGRNDPATPVPEHLLEDDTVTEVIRPTVEVAQLRLPTKGDAAAYMASVLGSLSDQEVAENDGLWTWLTLYFFDEVCPPRGGRRSVKNDYHYVFEHKNSRHFYRHLLFVSWQIRRIGGLHTRLFTGTKLSTLDKVTTEVMKRLYLTRIPCIFEVLDRLYWDEARGRARPGITDFQKETPGDLVHRLPLRLRQLEMTYDLQDLTAEQLLQLLGDEFRQGRALHHSAGK